jgi:hypothetical protein
MAHFGMEGEVAARYLRNSRGKSKLMSPRCSIDSPRGRWRQRRPAAWPAARLSTLEEVGALICPCGQRNEVLSVRAGDVEIDPREARLAELTSVPLQTWDDAIPIGGKLTTQSHHVWLATVLGVRRLCGRRQFDKNKTARAPSILHLFIIASKRLFPGAAPHHRPSFCAAPFCEDQLSLDITVPGKH